MILEDSRWRIFFFLGSFSIDLLYPSFSLFFQGNGHPRSDESNLADGLLRSASLGWILADGLLCSASLSSEYQLLFIILVGFFTCRKVPREISLAIRCRAKCHTGFSLISLVYTQ